MKRVHREDRTTRTIANGDEFRWPNDMEYRVMLQNAYASDIFHSHINEFQRGN